MVKSPAYGRWRRSDNGRPSSLRIVGGEWRGRRLPILDAPGLRPTSDRIRETLFNWLTPIIDGARCLDLFAGTGALGIEALSRGAASALLAEQSKAAAASIEQALRQLGADDRTRVLVGDSLSAPFAGPFDIVFVDPPFDADLHAPAIKVARQLLAANGRVYVEYPVGQRAAIHNLLQTGFEIRRDKQAGQVGYCLARFTGGMTNHE
ncbi:MAG: 16S rRNA (guanine(966)-N(2))-methyltransferase RsmD [Salinisphaera sp.]|jgi:16S rRNA (guanine966-N2)-methyltransferase|nr:16S rRNA (guanine(966)-N(2))-methyltransferase RsmD [Salinisphaera sp.]